MAGLGVQGMTHWSIPVNDLDEAEEFYGGLLGLESKGRLANDTMSCFSTGDTNILLCEQKTPVGGSPPGVHHSFTVAPEVLEQACRLFREKGVKVDSLVYRAQGHFTGREPLLLRPHRQPARTARPHLEQGDAGAAAGGALPVADASRAVAP